MSAKGEPDGAVYRQLSEEMRDGLKHIYKRISSAAEDTEGARTAGALFQEASEQLREIAKTTEEAAMSLLSIVEKQGLRAAETGEILRRVAPALDKADAERLAAMNDELKSDLSAALTALSFQDLTGQRLKKASEALAAIEKSVVELYVSSGLMLEGAEKDPQKDARALREEAKEAMSAFGESKPSRLRGPDRNGKSQSASDDMLAQLGL